MNILYENLIFRMKNAIQLQQVLNPLAPELFFFLILAHPVYKM